MRYILLACLSFVMLCGEVCSQAINIPKIYPSYFGLGVETASTVEWDTVANAESYKLFVSEDSTFTSPLPGMNGIFLTAPKNRASSGLTVFGLYPGTIYYYRLQACNSNTCSGNSQIIALRTTPSEYLPYIRLTTISNTSASIRWSPTIDVSISTTSIVQKYTTSLLPSRIITEVKNRFTLSVNNLRPETSHSIIVQSDTNANAGGSFVFFTTLSNKIAPFKKLISYYQLPNFRLTFAPTDTTLFFTLSDSTLTNTQADDLLLQMRSEGIPIEMAWFHEKGEIYFVRPSRPIPTPSTLTIKLQKSDDRIKKYKLQSGVGTWRYSDGLLYFQYVFDRPTSVSNNNGENRQLLISPNPANGFVNLSYSLSEATSIEITATNILGQLYPLLRLPYQEAGYHQVHIDAHTLPSGMYFIQVKNTVGGRNQSAILTITQ
jgi:Secretion system C-terminal sorting domain